MPRPQLRDLLLKGEHRRRVIQLRNQEQVAGGKHDKHDSISMDREAAEHQVRHANMIDPKATAEDGKKDAGDELNNLSYDQRLKAGPEASEFCLLDLVEDQRVLPLQVSVHGLPGGFEIVEFGNRHGYSL